MVHVQSSASAPVARGPWFRSRPEFTIALSVILFVAIFTVRLLIGDIRDGYSMLYSLPIALLATAFGRKAGLAAGLTAITLLVIWVLVKDVPMRPTGWISRILPMLLLGLLVGDASDRLRRSEDQRVELAAAARLHREAIEINDTLVQGMAAAKWSLEAGRTETGLHTLDETIGLGHKLVSGLIREAGLGLESGGGPEAQARRQGMDPARQ
jgi:glucose-6-phosphate-specific signal transduction histidine kinase